MRAILRKVRDRMGWMLFDVPKNPGFEIYARYQSMRLLSDIANRKALGSEGPMSEFADYVTDMPPRIVWMYWDSGEVGAPFVVKRCIESWRLHNPTWDIRVLDAETVSDYADMSDYPKIKLDPRFFANLLRVRLLRDHGGVWADATVFCHRPLDDWLPGHLGIGFFALKNPGASRRIASWFLVSTCNHRIVTIWERLYARYVRGLRKQPDIYFVFFYILQWRLRRNKDLEVLWGQVASLPAKPSLMMMPTLLGNMPEDLLLAMVKSGLPVSKLNWKIPLKEDDFDAFCARLPSLAHK